MPIVIYTKNTQITLGERVLGDVTLQPSRVPIPGLGRLRLAEHVPQHAPHQLEPVTIELKPSDNLQSMFSSMYLINPNWDKPLETPFDLQSMFSSMYLINRANALHPCRAFATWPNLAIISSG